MDNKYNFLYCQKIVVFSRDFSEVLLCRRASEADLDGVFSFIGGKMEITDSSLIEGMHREKTEEIGPAAVVKLYPKFSTNILFKKNDGSYMILPHYLAVFVSGTININEEYSEYKWVKLSELESFEPKVANIPQTIKTLLELKSNLQDSDFVTI